MSRLEFSETVTMWSASRAIATIVNDTDLRAELTRRGPLQAAKFSVERYRERVAAVYTALR